MARPCLCLQGPHLTGSQATCLKGGVPGGGCAALVGSCLLAWRVLLTCGIGGRAGLHPGTDMTCGYTEESGEWVYALSAWPGDRLCSYLATHLKGHTNLLDGCRCEHPTELHTGWSLPCAHPCQGSS